MSKGTKRFALRIPIDLKVVMEEAIKRRNDSVMDAPPWSVSDFVRIAVVEKLAKMERSKKGTRRYTTGAKQEWTTGPDGRLETPGATDDFDGGFYAEAEGQ